MTLQVKCYERMLSVLSLLQEHGPLSFRALRHMMKPPINPKRLHATLSRLQKAKLVTKRFEKLFGGSGVFYQLTQESSAVNRVAHALKCPVNDVKQPEFRYRELLHTQDTALWVYQLKQILPETKVVRDFNFHKHEIAKRIMVTDDLGYDLRPDILLILPSENVPGDEIAIAIEVERTLKSRRRIAEKLNKYANETFVDGLVYICSDNHISDTVCNLYKSGPGAKSLAIKHYAKNFLLFSDNTNIHNDAGINVHNSFSEPVSFLEWTRYLQTVPRDFRRDSEMSTRGAPYPPLSIRD